MDDIWETNIWPPYTAVRVLTANVISFEHALKIYQGKQVDQNISINGILLTRGVQCTEYVKQRTVFNVRYALSQSNIVVANC